MTEAPLILWFRRDLRLTDHPMLSAAVASGHPLVPVFILDPQTEALGAAAKFRLGLALTAFGQSLAGLGARLVLRRGPALEVLRALVAETAAAGVLWTRLYDPVARSRDQGVKAAMRQIYVTGTMHNRARMIVASYLTKHLLTDWRVGQAWFADCLTDWDPASNAMGWQWVAGSGPDAAPCFRIFNPATQAAKFDPDGDYRRRWLDPASPDARSFFDAVPKSWGLDPAARRPDPLISLESGRARALAALAERKA